MQEKPNTLEYSEYTDSPKKVVSEQKMVWKTVSSHSSYEEAAALKVSLLEQGVPAKIRRVGPREGRIEMFILKSGTEKKVKQQDTDTRE